MSLYYDRYHTVHQLLRQEKRNSVLDFGCGDGKFLSCLLEDLYFVHLGGVDISQPRLARAVRRIGASPRIHLYQQSFLEDNPKFRDYSSVTVLEVIEHLDRTDLDRLIWMLFHVVMPSLVIITTPNRSYNFNYPVLYNGLRHSSHKFEFNELELYQFGEKIAYSSKYSFCTGFCDPDHSCQFIMLRRCCENEKQ